MRQMLHSSDAQRGWSFRISSLRLSRSSQGWGVSAEFEPRALWHEDVETMLEDQTGIWNLQALKLQDPFLSFYIFKEAS